MPAVGRPRLPSPAAQRPRPRKAEPTCKTTKAPTTAGRWRRTARSTSSLPCCCWAVCAIVIYDSARLGFNWREGEGPAPGYFPFYVAVILGISSLINLVGALRGRGAGEIFVSARPFGRVLAVLIPSLVYVALIGGISLGPDRRAGARHLCGLGHLHLRVHDRDRAREPAQGPGRRHRSCRSRCSSCSRNGSSCPCPRARSRPGSATEARRTRAADTGGRTLTSPGCLFGRPRGSRLPRLLQQPASHAARSARRHGSLDSAAAD